MAIQKKHGKGRLDKWYKLAKEKGYRARAAFKLIQLNKKYNFLQNAKVVIDLCAAPGSWCQVAAEAMPKQSLIVGVDLSPIKQIPGVITFQSDITTEKCRATIRSHLKTWKADVVLHDGAPNVGTAWVQDAFTQAELVLQSLKLATEFLVPNGTFVTKVFRSRDFNNLMWVFNQLFTKVEATKPPSSRNVSAEIFVVCRGFKAPKRIDPAFLDPRTVFEELPDAAPNNEAKVYKPELKKRKRDGYEEGDYLQFKECSVNEFIETNDPIDVLGTMNRLHFREKTGGDIAIAAISKMPDTTDEIRNCCEDLKVLGRKDFKRLLKWRLSVREKFGLIVKKKGLKDEEEGKETAEITPMDEELQMEEDLERMKDELKKDKKKSKRKANEHRQKEIVRMQLNMGAPMDIGMEQENDAMFKLKTVDKAGAEALSRVSKGKMNVVVEDDSTKRPDVNMGEDQEEDEDEAEDRLEDELDQLYNQYTERKSEADAKYRAKRARKDDEDGEWHGFSDQEEESDNDVVAHEQESSDDDDEEVSAKKLIRNLEIGEQSGNALSKKATMFFDQDIFAGIDQDVEEEQDEEDEDEEMKDSETDSKADSEVDSDDSNSISEPEWEDGDDDAKDSDKIEIVKSAQDVSWDAKEEPLKNGRPVDIDIITAEAMALAQALQTGKITKHDLLDDNWNKYSFRDKDGLPDWFLDDESKHSKLQRPITAAAAAAIKEKQRALNARPIKKVREAKDRKKFKAVQKLEKMKRKSAQLVDDEGMTEKEKAASIGKVMAKAGKKKPKEQVKVVVARGTNKGQGRPRGVKGRYKIVDSRLKKDVRAQRRAAKKRK